MVRLLAGCLLSLLLAGSAWGQQPIPPSQPGAQAMPGMPVATPGAVPGTPGAEGERPAAPVVWGVAILGTFLILSIVCVPSRKV